MSSCYLRHFRHVQINKNLITIQVSKQHQHMQMSAIPANMGILNKGNVQQWRIYLFSYWHSDVFYFTLFFMDFLSCEQQTVERRSCSRLHVCIAINLQQLTSWLGWSLVRHVVIVVKSQTDFFSPHMDDFNWGSRLLKYFLVMFKCTENKTTIWNINVHVVISLKLKLIYLKLKGKLCLPQPFIKLPLNKTFNSQVLSVKLLIKPPLINKS